MKALLKVGTTALGLLLVVALSLPTGASAVEEVRAYIRDIDGFASVTP